MPGLDLFTLNCVTIANAYLSSSAMYFVSKLNGRAHGIRYCAVAGFVVSTGFALAPLRSLSPGFPGQALNLLSNVLILWGACLLLRGIRGFRGLRLVRRRRFNTVLIIYSVLFAYFIFGQDSLRARTVLASLALAATMAAAGLAMGVGVKRRDRPVYWTTASFYMATAFTAGLRGLWYLRAIPHTTIFANAPVEYLSIIAVNLASLGGAFGLCLATNLTLMRETEELAHYDPLTNLPNRRLLEERLATAEQRALDSGQSLAVIYCDLDNFKDVNDRLGHEAGDRVLKAVADRLRRLVDDDMCLARVGGDEFIILVENPAKREDLHQLVENLSSSVELPIHIDGELLSPAISCGIAVYPDDVGSASDLVRLADAAMYAMKQHGRMASYMQE